MKNKYINLIKDTVLFAIGTIGSKIILFVLVPLYTNCLSPAEYGIADLVFTLALLLLPFACLGIHHAIIRFGLEKKDNPSDVLFCGLVIAFVGSIIVLSITPLLGFHKGLGEWKWYFAAYLILHMYLSIFQNYAKAIGKNKAYALVSILYTLVLALLNVLFLLYSNMGVRGYLMANVLATVVAVFIFMFVCDVFTLSRRAKLSKPLLKAMLKYSAPLMVDGTIWWIIQSSNKVFVETFMNTEMLGFYTVTIKIPSLMYIVVTIFSQAWGISTIKESDNENESRFYENVFSVYTFLTFFICLTLIALIKPFMSIYVGEEYFVSWKYIPLLLAGTAFLAISDFFGAFYNALKLPVRNMCVSLIAAIISVLIATLSMEHIGMWAAILATFFAYLVIMWIRLLDIKKYIKMKICWNTFLLNQLLLIAFAILITLDCHILIVSTIGMLLFGAINIKFVTRTINKIWYILKGQKAR